MLGLPALQSELRDKHTDPPPVALLFAAGLLSSVFLVLPKLRLAAPLIPVVGTFPLLYRFHYRCSPAPLPRPRTSPRTSPTASSGTKPSPSSPGDSGGEADGAAKPDGAAAEDAPLSPSRKKRSRSPERYEGWGWCCWVFPRSRANCATSTLTHLWLLFSSLPTSFLLNNHPFQTAPGGTSYCGGRHTLHFLFFGSPPSSARTTHAK